MHKKNVYKKHLIFAAKLLLVAASYYYLYQKLSNSADFKNFISSLNSFSQENWKFFIIAMILMPLNWTIESIKWRKLVQKLHPVSLTQSFKAVLSGISVGVFTPNRIGELGGRLIVLPKEAWKKGVYASAYGGLAQFMITVMAGSAGIFLLAILSADHIFFSHIKINHALILSAVLIILLILLFFNLNFWMQKLGQIIPNKLKKEVIHYTFPTSIITLMYSFIRYAVFLIQFYLLLRFFSVQISMIESLWAIALTYLITTIIPTSTLLELGIRGAVAVFFLGIFSDNHTGILSASILLWFINIALPAIVGSILFLKSKPLLASKQQYARAKLR